MAIPPLNDHGLLPEGIHNCTMEEAGERFGGFLGTDRRPKLWARFSAFYQKVKAAGFAVALVVDGSFITGKPDPNDIDLLLVLPIDWDMEAELTPDRYNLLSKKRVQRLYGFDILLGRENSKQQAEHAAFFQRVRGRDHLRKGILRISL